jgi:TRAP-type C4-dicarboxylate transport system permease small subunit
VGITMKYWNKAGAIFDGILNGLAFLSALLLAFIMLSICLEVIMRYFLNRPLVWVIEITEYSLLYITFLGTAWLLRREGHVTVDILLVRLNPKTRAALGLFSSIIGIVISLVLIWYGSEVAWDHYQRGVFKPTVLQFPTAPILAIIPTGSVILAMQFIRRGYVFLRKWREDAS